MLVGLTSDLIGGSAAPAASSMLCDLICCCVIQADAMWIVLLRVADQQLPLEQS